MVMVNSPFFFKILWKDLQLPDLQLSVLHPYTVAGLQLLCIKPHRLAEDTPHYFPHGRVFTASDI